jgi:hypothetical protein
MRHNPITQTLFTHSMDVLKQLHCPLNKEWDHLLNTPHSHDRLCGSCNHQVVDTSLAKATSKHLLKVDLSQSNTTITYDK